ncbi:MAG: hypothetical protein GF388_11935 [Candidatus Aegiribacteria sp.]|nr:hypothetical protein [Candidatus Aegiribacteria sp.]MBD3295678.1 hypothetical protein [Candidatus Fermentibacteria bacterium]
MTIGRVSWQRGGSYGSETGYYNSFKLYIGLSDSAELTDTYSDNYIPGSRVMVYSTTTQVMSAAPDEWMTVELDTPFYYNGSDNLILELEWAGGSNMFYTYMWDTGSNRGLMNKVDIGSPTGVLYSSMSRLMFDSPVSLDAATFGEIKALLGS